MGGTRLREPPNPGALEATYRARGYHLSPALCFGLGTGLYFEYCRGADGTTSRYINGCNQHLEVTLGARIPLFANGTAPSAIRDALRENALLFILDRAPTTALMGMEMLAEELPHWKEIGDWRLCTRGIAQEINRGGSLYRRLYIEFLREIERYDVPGDQLADHLQDIADEWDALAGILDRATGEPANLEQAARTMRRIAMREEHFWGQVLDSC